LWFYSTIFLWLLPRKVQLVSLWMNKKNELLCVK
jgi:hypothetical protein